MPPLGIIEAYFGRAWSWEARHAVVDRLTPAGYRFFHYAPKIDARLRREWQRLHDPEEAARIARFAAHCRARGWRFGVGVTPMGCEQGFGSTLREKLRAKLAQIDDWGVDDLVILFDDMRGDLPDLAERQAEICGFAMAHSRATNIFFCPSYYSLDPVLDRVFGARPAGYLETLGRLLPADVHIYWTGEEVCAPEIGPGHLARMQQIFGRRVALWDNYPVNDGPRMSGHLHLRAFTGRKAANAPLLSHHAINPASQPVLACIPALTLPMIYAEGDDYRYSAAFDEAAQAVCGEPLAAMLKQDLARVQLTGLANMTADTRAALRARYAAIDHPAAREIVDWLDGGYAITGEMLQTQ